MPLYDYKCREHGIFHELATMAQAGAPGVCPQCRQPSPRVLMIPPEVLAMAPAKRKAMERNEQAKHEPIVVGAESRMEAAAEVQRKNCSCKKHGLILPDKPAKLISAGRQVIFGPDGSKLFPAQRPWMISH